MTEDIYNLQSHGHTCIGKANEGGTYSAAHSMALISLCLIQGRARASVAWVTRQAGNGGANGGTTCMAQNVITRSGHCPSIHDAATRNHPDHLISRTITSDD